MDHQIRLLYLGTIYGLQDISSARSRPLQGARSSGEHLLHLFTLTVALVSKLFKGYLWEQGRYFSFDKGPGASKKQPSRSHTSKGKSGAGNKNERHILIVEDDRVSVLYIKELIKMLEIPEVKLVPHHVFTGEKALEYVRNEPCDLVLMDLKLPGIDGLDTTRFIKRERPALPVIAQTAFALSGDEQKAMEAGCDDYLSKPISEKVLVEKIRKHLDLT